MLSSPFYKLSLSQGVSGQNKELCSSLYLEALIFVPIKDIATSPVQSPQELFMRLAMCALPSKVVYYVPQDETTPSAGPVLDYCPILQAGR
jgi:hypothetical protein